MHKLEDRRLMREHGTVSDLLAVGGITEMLQPRTKRHGFGKRMSEADVAYVQHVLESDWGEVHRTYDVARKCKSDITALLAPPASQQLVANPIQSALLRMTGPL
jgi:hypothetical protein